MEEPIISKGGIGLTHVLTVLSFFMFFLPNSGLDVVEKFWYPLVI
jgi:hypothetical protein